jgi:hypothetical protein
VGWLARRRRSRFPEDMIRRLELLGRFEMDHVGSGIDSSEVLSDSIRPFRSDARADPDGFVSDLRAVIATEDRGFATYGACCLIIETIGYEFRSEDALALLDDGIAFKRERGLPSACLTGYEWHRWLDVNGPGTW